MSGKIEEALATPFKRVKSADREIEYLSTNELLKRNKLLTSKTRPLLKQVSISRTRDL